MGLCSADSGGTKVAFRFLKQLEQAKFTKIPYFAKFYFWDKYGEVLFLRKFLYGSVPDSKSRNIPEVVIVRRGVVGVLGIWRGWVSWVKGGANGVSLQAT